MPRQVRRATSVEWTSSDKGHHPFELVAPLLMESFLQALVFAKCRCKVPCDLVRLKMRRIAPPLRHYCGHLGDFTSKRTDQCISFAKLPLQSPDRIASPPALHKLELRCEVRRQDALPTETQGLNLGMERLCPKRGFWESK